MSDPESLARLGAEVGLDADEAFAGAFEQVLGLIRGEEPIQK